MGASTLHELYIEELRDLYSAEQQITKALPKMAKMASTPELRSAFEEHLEVTGRQIERLEQIFENLGKSPKGKKCGGMEGLLKEGKEQMEEVEKGDTLDAAMIVAAQKVEHYEIAGYGSVRTFANTLGRDEDARLLEETLDEEAETDEKLTTLAEQCGINEGSLEDEDDKPTRTTARKKQPASSAKTGRGRR